MSERLLTIEQVHNILVHMLDGFEVEDVVESVVVEPDEPREALELQARLNVIIREINELDCFYHDHWEQYCG